MVFDGTREDHFPELMAWAAENGASCEGFEICNFAEQGFGLKATRDIKVSADGGATLTHASVEGFGLDEVKISTCVGRGAVPVDPPEDAADGGIGKKLSAW